MIIPLALPKNYWWAIPKEMEELVKPGVRVEVGLGKNKKYAGLVKKIHSRKPENIEPKQILNVLDAEPILFEKQLKLWEWMANYYMCSEGEVMAAALPAHFKLNSETWLEFNPDFGDNFSSLDHDEFLVAEAAIRQLYARYADAVWRKDRAALETLRQRGIELGIVKLSKRDIKTVDAAAGAC